MKKRVLSIFLAVCLVFTLLPVGALAESNSVDTEPSLAVSGTNSVGKLIAKEVSQETDDTSGGNKISDLTIDGSTAAVQFTTDTNECDIVVAIYDENDETKMLASGTVTVYAGDSEASVELTGEIPESFVATAYMLERESHSPMCNAYTTKMYTSEMQAFLATTVNDYDDELVFNLDDSEETNFAVFNDGTLRADESSGMSVEDKGDGTYVVTNADADVKALSEGDEFAFTYDDGTMLLVAVASITVDGDTVTITEATDADLQDFFDYVKIEGTNDENTKATIDTSEMDDCVTLIEEAAPQRARARNTDIDGSIGNSFSAKIKNDKLEGAVTYSYELSLKVYINNGYKSVSLTNKSKLELSVAVEPFKKDLMDIKLCSINVPIVPGVKVQVAPTLVIQASVKIQWKVSIETTIGFGYDSDIGFVNKCSGPKCDSKVELSGKVFVGLKASVSVDIISDKIASLGLEAKLGAEVSAKERVDNDSTGSKKHECERCITGEIYGVASLTAKANFITFKTEQTFAETKIKVADFYVSFTFGASDWGTCPHISYKVTVKALDKDGNPLPNATVTCSALPDKLTTDKEGKVSFFAPNGEYNLNIESNDLKADRKLTVHSSKKELSVRLTPPPKVVASGKCGDDITWQLDEAGTLTISGTGEMYDYNGMAANYSPWDNKRTDVKKVVVKGDVTNIGDYAFWGCGNLASVSLPDSVTRIGSRTFNGCANLSSLKFPKKLVAIENEAFENCRMLTKITLPDNVTSIGGNAFSNCRGLESIILPASLISIGRGAFAGCDSLTKITIPSNVDNIGDDAFESCDKLESICVEAGNANYCSNNGILYNKDMTKILRCPEGKKDISQFDIPDGVTEIGTDAFSECMELGIVKIPSSVTTIGADAFALCKNLYSVNIPQSVTSIGARAFRSCNKLTSIVIPDGVESIERATFMECYYLAKIWIPSSVKKVGENAFWFCNSLKNVYYSGSEEQWNEIEFDRAYLSSNATIHYNSPYIDLTSPSNLKVYDDTNTAVTTGTESSAPVKAAATQSADSGSQVKTSSFGELQSGAQYVFIVVLDPNAEEFLASDNLCYIAQNAADETGNLGFSYYSDADTVSENIYALHAHSYKNGECTVCGSTDPSYEPHEHSFGEWTATKQATCTDAGIETRTCECGESETRTVDALGHDTVHHEAKAATCTENGWAAYDTCSRCDYSTYKEIAATGHHHNAVVTAPTCTAKGYTTHTCACGDSYKDSYTNALGHSYANGKCTRCGAADPNYNPAPAAPALKITTVSGKPKISWNAVDGAAKYWVYRSTDGKTFKYYDSTTKTSYTNSSTSIGTTYYYKVKAVAVVDGKNYASAYSVTKSILCKPAAPTVSINRSNGKPKLSWKAASGAMKYWIYRSTDGVNFKYYDSTTKTSYTNSGAASGTKYYYRVKAVAVVNGKNVTSANSSTKSLMTTLAKPSVSITTSNGKPKITWKAVTGADKYYIYRSTDGKTFKFFDSTTKTSYTNSGAKKNTKYYYKVKAVCASNSNANSAQSSTVSIKATK